MNVIYGMPTTGKTVAMNMLISDGFICLDTDFIGKGLGFETPFNEEVILKISNFIFLSRLSDTKIVIFTNLLLVNDCETINPIMAFGRSVSDIRYFLKVRGDYEIIPFINNWKPLFNNAIILEKFQFISDYIEDIKNIIRSEN